MAVSVGAVAEHGTEFVGGHNYRSTRAEKISQGHRDAGSGGQDQSTAADGRQDYRSHLTCAFTAHITGRELGVLLFNELSFQVRQQQRADIRRLVAAALA